MKLYERLKIQNFAGAGTHLGMLQTAERESTKTEFEAAWNRLNRADLRGLLALDYYLLNDGQNAALHGRKCLCEADEFLFGRWRSDFKTPGGAVDPRWWKERFTWMEVYEHCLLWGAALADWSFLKRVSQFPEEAACLSMGTKPQDRDALVAIAAILRGDSHDECASHINRLLAGPKKGGKLLAAALKALLDMDSDAFEPSVAAYLQQYKKAEFPKDKLTKKVSIEGTLIVNWARYRGLDMEMPAEFEDHIVKLKK